MSLLNGAKLGPYEIVGPLGAGGMGEVYRAKDTRLGRTVAVKVLALDSIASPVSRERFEREARTISRLSHPRICSLHDIGDQDGRPFLVMELLEGETLADRLQRGALPIDLVLRYGAETCEALSYAHRQGIVHRDLKPANVMLTKQGAKLLDFGLAQAMSPPPQALDLSGATASTHLTREGTMVGTPQYMAPEQIEGRPVDARTDLFALGGVLYEMVTGQPAFTGKTAPSLIGAVLKDIPPPASQSRTQTPPALDRLIAACLAKDPNDRVQSAHDVMLQLRWILESPEGPTTASPRLWLAIAGVALTAIGVAAGAGISLLRAPSATAAVPIMRQLTASRLTSYGKAESQGAISPDGRSFAFVSDHDGTTDVWVRLVSGGETVRLTNDAEVEADVVYAPDGGNVYYTSGSSIWAIGALGGQARRVLNAAEAPSPSPDGQRLAWFASGAAGGVSLVVGAIDGSNPRVLASGFTPGSGFSNVPGRGRAAWSPDGSALAYSSGGLFEPRNLFVIDVASGEARQVTHFTGGIEGIITQAWLPDNRHLIVSYIPSPHAVPEMDLGVLNVETGAMVRLTLNTDEAFNAPSVSSDGTRIVVTSTRLLREVWKVPFGTDPIANGRAAVRLLDASQDPMYTYVTRDGRTLLVSNALVGSRNLWTMPVDLSAKPRQVTSVPGDSVTHASLSPDGTGVTFISIASGTPDVWVQNVDGAGLRNLTKDAAAETWPVWSPDGRSIVYGSSGEIRRIPADGGPVEKLFDGGFRGDWIARRDGPGSLIATATPDAGLRLLDVEGRRVIWERRDGGILPMFSSDGRQLSAATPDGRDRHAITVYDVASGSSRVAVRFSQPFRIGFRVSWTDNDRAFVVNRQQLTSHIVMLDNFWKTAAFAAHAGLQVIRAATTVHVAHPAHTERRHHFIGAELRAGG